jgi:glutamyl-tRNA reductase
MNILIIGLNHKTASLDVREKLAFDGDLLKEGLTALRQLPGISEAALLSTCNRVEIYASVKEPSAAAEEILNFIASFRGIPRSGFEGSLYILNGEEAVRHLLRVASSLDSMVVGEPQILGQLKDAFDAALSVKATGFILNRLLKKAISTAKRVRTETKIAENAVSISYAAVELARKIFTGLSGKSVMLMGAGDMAELAARHLMKNGVQDIRIANRTFGGAASSQRNSAARPCVSKTLCRNWFLLI